jgi:succinate dehydrogenase / fumarate reductase cytochrome b subunit
MLVSHNYFTSSIGKKQIMALTGIGLLGFTLTHLIGNFLLFLGADAFNMYAYTLTSNPLIYVAEAGLIGMFMAHIALAAITKTQNTSARDQRYLVKKSTGRGETFASKTMAYTGGILGIFVVLHLINFKFGDTYMTTIDGVEVRDLYKTVVLYFSNPLYVAWYVFAMFTLGVHTSHGVQSSFQSLGLWHKKYTPFVKLASNAYGIFVTIGFSALAIYCHFQN